MTLRDLAHKEKQELKGTAENTRPARAYLPDVDIFETDAAMVLVADMPGVASSELSINVHDHRLLMEGRVSPADYDGLSPLYTEYNVGPFRREFDLGADIDTEKIEAKIVDGVVTVLLPKSERTRPRKIAIAAA